MRALLLVFALAIPSLADESPFRPTDGKPETLAVLAKDAGKPVLLALLDDG
jgi:hypothetical protein